MGGGGSNAISVVDNAFDPDSVLVTKGSTVTWTWAPGSTLHSVTFDDGATSATISSGSYSRTFNATGTFHYHCKVHGVSMSGTVTVH